MYCSPTLKIQRHTYQVSLLGSDSHSCLLNLTPNIILDLTPSALILKYCTIGGKWKSHSSACSTLGSYAAGGNQGG